MPANRLPFAGPGPGITSAGTAETRCRGMRNHIVATALWQGDRKRMAGTESQLVKSEMF